MSIYTHENYMPLKQADVLWRYMSFYKFHSLLETRCLFFCRADKFSDPFEGSIPKKEANNRMKEQVRSSFALRSKLDQKQFEENIRGISDLHKRFRRAVIINCWQINQNESDAMWRLYLKNNEGVAIQTNRARLYDAIKNTVEEISTSKVRYIDFEEDQWYHPVDYPHTNYNLIVPFVHKRKEFIHENEFRLFIQVDAAIDNIEYWDNQSHDFGKFVSVNLESLIEKVILPPSTDEKAIKKIKNLSQELGFKFTYETSKLSTEPFF